MSGDSILELALTIDKKVHFHDRVIKNTDERRTVLIFTALHFLLYKYAPQHGNKKVRPLLKAFVTKYMGEIDSPTYTGLVREIHNWLDGSSFQSTVDWLMSA